MEQCKTCHGTGNITRYGQDRHDKFLCPSCSGSGLADNSSIPLTIQALILAKKDGKEEGTISCPKCNGILNYSKASNGHTRGRCQTDNCLSWIE